MRVLPPPPPPPPGTCQQEAGFLGAPGLCAVNPKANCMSRGSHWAKVKVSAGLCSFRKLQERICFLAFSSF